MLQIKLPGARLRVGEVRGEPQQPLPGRGRKFGYAEASGAQAPERPAGPRLLGGPRGAQWGPRGGREGGTG